MKGLRLYRDVAIGLSVLSIMMGSGLISISKNPRSKSTKK